MTKIMCVVCGEHSNEIPCVQYQRQKIAKQILEELMDNIEDAQQAYKEGVWSGEESLSSLWCTYKIKLDELKKEKK